MSLPPLPGAPASPPFFSTTNPIGLCDGTTTRQPRYVVPPFEAFRDPATYYATLAHEATHWTGHAKRCVRDLRGRFSKEVCAAKELIAELGAAFVRADLTLTPEPRPYHAAYVGSWLKVLRSEKRAIFTVAAKAQQTADWMHARHLGAEDPGAVAQVRAA